MLFFQLKSDNGHRGAPSEHIPIGLPSGVPSLVELPSGSFVKSLAPQEFRPFRFLGGFFGILPILFVLVLMAIVFPLSELEETIGRDPEKKNLWDLLNTIGLSLLVLCLIGIAGSVFGHRALRRKVLLRSLRLRPTKLSDIGWEDPIVLAIEDSRSYKKLKLLSDDYGLMRIGSGFLEIEMGRAQVHIKAEDLNMEIHKTASGKKGLRLCAHFGKCLWAVTVAEGTLLRPIKPQVLASKIAQKMQIGEIKLEEKGDELEEPLETKILTFSTETWGSRLYFWGMVGFASLMGAFYIFLEPLIGLTATPSSEPESLPSWFYNVSFWFFFLLGILFFGLAILAILKRIHGEWRLDSQGVVYTPIGKPGVSLRWGEVERVRWLKARLDLCGRGITIIFDPVSFSATVLAPARKMIQQHLGSDFDLAMRRLEISRFQKITHYALALVAGFILVAAFTVWFLYWKQFGLWGSLLLVAIVVLVMASLVLIKIRRKLRFRELNPEWRERIEKERNLG